MPAEPVPEDHHIARHCKGTELREDGTPHPAAFISDDLDGISCNWLEYFSGDLASRLSDVRTAISARRTVRGTHRLAILNVGTARARAFEKLGQSIAIVKDPLPEDGDTPSDPSHALIEQVAEAAREALGEALAECVLQTVPAKK